ncbi:MAG: PrsW family intramembrane metalloprotease [bacterium]|nr:PrsW family intramembrane metalloprotease [bacterium]
MRTSFISVLFLSVFIGFTPVIFYGWLFFLRRKKKFQQGKQPTAMLSMMFLGGIASVVFAFFVERYLIQFLPAEFSYCVASSPLCETTSVVTIGILALATFAIVAPVEEGFKFLSVYFISLRSTQFTRIIDGAKYGIAAALGFASAENALYLFTSLNQLDLNTFVSTFLLRFALSSPAHLFYSGIFGYYIGKAQFTRYGRGRLIATGLFLAILTHGLYDFVLFSQVGFYAIFLLVILFGVLYFVFKSPENFAVRIPEFMRRHPSTRDKIMRIPVEQELSPANQGLRTILAEIPKELQPITPQNLKPEYLPKEVPSEFAEQFSQSPVRAELNVPVSTVPVRSIKAPPGYRQPTTRPRPAIGPVPERTVGRALRVQTKSQQKERLSRRGAAGLVDRSVVDISRRRLNVMPT